MSKKPERVSNVCKQNDHLKWLYSHAQQINKLNVILQKSLPLQFSNHCHLANITQDKIIVHTDNASYASLLRFQAVTICNALSAHLPEPIHKLDVKVRPKEAITQNVQHAALHVSTKTAVLLNNTADSIENGPLKTALNNLAKNTPKN